MREGKVYILHLTDSWLVSEYYYISALSNGWERGNKKVKGNDERKLESNFKGVGRNLSRLQSLGWD